MDPISNKKDFEDLTTNLRDLAFSYIEKYSPSKQQVKTYLLKKYLNKFQGSKSKKDISAIIDKIVSNLEKNRLIDDRLYSDSKARVFLRRGYSINKIGMALRTKGIGTENIKLSIEKSTIIKIVGIDKELVGKVSSEIRRLKPVEPYKGKGISERGQYILRKEGKKK